MTDPTKKETPRSRVKKSFSPILYGVIVLLIALAAGCYFYIQLISSNANNKNSDPIQYGTVETGKGSGDKPHHDATSVHQEIRNTPENAHLRPSHANGVNMEEESVVTTLDDKTDELASSANPIDKITFIPDYNCNLLFKELNAFYQHLDKQPYMNHFGLTEPSKEHFSKLIQKLIDNPPTVARETDDLFTLLKNTAHFFRVLGKDNILMLKGILDREKLSVESTLKVFYDLIQFPVCLQEEYNLIIPFDSVYDYAGFFLNTMGGRLYLFRRDSTSRMAVSYYAILIIDKAISEGNSFHGIDLVPAINFLIDEMETGGKRLQMREDYLDTLYDLKEKYN